MAQSYRAESSALQIQCVLIADDLTGACDAAAPFRAQGATARVLLDAAAEIREPANVVSVNIDSRDLSAVEMRRRIEVVAARFRELRPNIIFKKIDSTLRGNPGEEIAAALGAFNCEVAIITPAFPAMGRHVRNEHLSVDEDPDWRPIHVQSLLQTQGLHTCRHVFPTDLQPALLGECRFISAEAASEQDLETIVKEALACGRRVLWAGSAGLASALAQSVFPAHNRPQHLVRQNQPVVFAVGSDHAVTRQQLQELGRRFAIQHLNADSVTPEMFTASLHARRHVVLKIGRATTSQERLAAILNGSRPEVSGLLLSGGDTASLVCRAAGVASLALEGEIVTGLPWGTAQGGSFERLPVATKSGGFGGADALIKVAEFFSCLAH